MSAEGLGESYLRKRFSERIWNSSLVDSLDDDDIDPLEPKVADLVEGLLIELGF